MVKCCQTDGQAALQDPVHPQTSLRIGRVSSHSRLGEGVPCRAVPLIAMGVRSTSDCAMLLSALPLDVHKMYLWRSHCTCLGSPGPEGGVGKRSHAVKRSAHGNAHCEPKSLKLTYNLLYLVQNDRSARDRCSAEFAMCFQQLRSTRPPLSRAVSTVSPFQSQL